jgi:ferritin-like metal-binding protein YciE
MKLMTLEDLLIEQLRDLLDAETRILAALPKMEKAATNPQLKKGFRDHLSQTKMHVERLKHVMTKELKTDAKRKTCHGIMGLLEEGEEFVAMKDSEINDDVRDAGLIAAAQRVEHYEMAGYGCVCTYLQQLGYDDAASVLHKTLDEEEETDERLTSLAENAINPAAEHPDGEDNKRTKTSGARGRAEQHVLAMTIAEVLG